MSNLRTLLRSAGCFLFLAQGCGPNEDQNEATSPVVIEDISQLTASCVSACGYIVITSAVKVYEKPTDSSTYLKTKHSGDHITGARSCDWTYYNSTEHVEYLAVSTTSSSDCIGWMNRAALRKL